MIRSFKYDVVINYLASKGFRNNGFKDDLHLWDNDEIQIPIPSGIDLIPGFFIGTILNKTGDTILDIELFDV